LYRGPRVSPTPARHLAARGVALHWSDEAEQTALRAVPENVAAGFDPVASTHVLAPDAVTQDACWGRRFERPRRGVAVLVLDVEIEQRVRHDKTHLLNRAFERHPLRDVIARV